MLYKSKYFKIEELVSKEVLAHYGESRCWGFLDINLLKALDRLRANLGRAITVNNWFWGGPFSQRGLRANLDPICSSKTIKGSWYNSQHSMGRGVDFDVKGMSAKEVRAYLVEHQSEYPEITYVEDDVSWVHMDTRNSIYEGLHLFKV